MALLHSANPAFHKSTVNEPKVKTLCYTLNLQLPHSVHLSIIGVPHVHTLNLVHNRCRAFKRKNPFELSIQPSRKQSLHNTFILFASIYLTNQSHALHSVPKCPYYSPFACAAFGVTADVASASANHSCVASNGAVVVSAIGKGVGKESGKGACVLPVVVAAPFGSTVRFNLRNITSGLDFHALLSVPPTLLLPLPLSRLSFLLTTTAPIAESTARACQW